jgi:hypothetical protein
VLGLPGSLGTGGLLSSTRPRGCAPGAALSLASFIRPCFDTLASEPYLHYAHASVHALVSAGSEPTFADASALPFSLGALAMRTHALS